MIWKRIFKSAKEKGRMTRKCFVFLLLFFFGFFLSFFFLHLVFVNHTALHSSVGCTFMAGEKSSH